MITSELRLLKHCVSTQTESNTTANPVNLRILKQRFRSLALKKKEVNSNTSFVITNSGVILDQY